MKARVFRVAGPEPADQCTILDRRPAFQKNQTEIETGVAGTWFFNLFLDRKNKKLNFISLSLNQNQITLNFNELMRKLRNLQMILFEVSRILYPQKY